MQPARPWLLPAAATAALLWHPSLCTARVLAPARADVLSSSQAVSNTSSAWRAYACMVPFTASDATPLLMLYGGTTTTASGGGGGSDRDPLSVASKGTSSLLAFDMGKGRWYAPSTANTPKTGPVLPGCGAASGAMWAYDPHYGVASAASTMVSLLDTVHWSWSAPTMQGQLPVTRFGAAFAYVPDKQVFYMHGGIALAGGTNTAGGSSGTVNNLDMLFPSSLSWSYGSNGPARKYHTLCYMSAIEAIVLFGGSDGNVPSYNDVKVLSTATNTWDYSPKISGDAPAERVLHSAVCTKDTMYVFGGLHSTDDEPSDSAVWILKAKGPAEFVWSKAPITKDAQVSGPTARAGHAAAIYDGSMYIYGGVGPSGQDSTMYRLDLGTWAWLQTTAGGSGSGPQEGKSRTAVIIAATVSSVLGIVVVGIAATIVYRIVRRRRRRGGAFSTPGRRGSGAQSTIDSDATSDVAAPLGDGKSGPVRNDSALRDTGRGAADCSHGTLGGSPVLQSPPGYQPDSGGGGGGVEEVGGALMVATPLSMMADLPLSPAGGSSPASRRWLLADAVRARARTLSNRLGSPRPSVLPMDDLSAGQRRRADTARRARSRRPTEAAEMDMYGRDYARVESEYRQAEAINEILLSGQPIPTWLRDAVNQAQDARADGGHTAPAARAGPERQLTIANSPGSESGQ
ncbi:hypothetical protein H4R18_000330 [Coemansia javaensis]|uniref:Galactose oxidase n=1 Tax=Coemansia javaensis TaxID=2761396 RepID=A0A9W8HLJ3_9FUNG|nr:hypothetical protein H4R18_000330 [Coemansia javaensis]